MFDKVFDQRIIIWSKTYNFGLHFINSVVSEIPYGYKKFNLL